MEAEDIKALEKLKREKKKAEKKNQLKEVATISNCIGELLVRYGQYEEAISEHEEERSISETLKDVIGEAVACRKIGECYCSLRQFDKAISLQKRHLDLAKSCENTVEEQRAWATIGLTYFNQSEATRSSATQLEYSKKAEDGFLKSLEVCERLKTKIKVEEYMEMKARLFLNLGLVYDIRGDIKQCAEHLKRAISISEKYRLYLDVYRCQYNLADIYKRNGKVTQALRALDDAQKNAQKLKDKHLESEALLHKAQIQITIGDFETAKHCLKKAKKLGVAREENVLRLYKLYKSATKMEESCEDLEKTEDEKCRMRLYESLGDCSVDAGNLKQALEYYHKMLDCATDLGLDDKDMIPIYVSLAQTYADDKQYTLAIKYYKQELVCHANDLEQTCRTWLNIAEAEENENLGYSKISKSYLAAFEAARKTKHRRLQVQVLRSLSEVQKYFKQKEHLAVTEAKLEGLVSKYGDLSEDESQPTDVGEDNGEEEVVISDLSESEDEDNNDLNTTITSSNITTTSRPRRTTVKTKRNEKGETPLHRACIEGNFKKVKKLIEEGHQVNPRDYCGWIPLHEAANHDFYGIVKYLLQHGAHVNDRGGERCGGVTPLIDAANCGNMEIVELLIQNGANILAKDDEGLTALDCLREWHGRCEDTINADLERQYKHTLQLLHSGNNNSSISSNHVRNITSSSQTTTLSQLTDEDDLPDLSSAKKVKRQKELSLLKKTPRALIAVDSVENSETTDDFFDNSEEIYLNPALENLHTETKSATEDYRNAISLVGKSAAQSSQGPSSTQKRKSSEPIEETDALLSESCYVGDDWLIDDLKPSNKRKFMDSGGFTSGSSARSLKGSGTKRQKTTNSIHEDESSNDSSTICNTNDNEMNARDSDLDFLIIDDLSPEVAQTKKNSQRCLPLKRKPKQTRITNFSTSSERREVIGSNKQTSKSGLGQFEAWDSNSNDSVESGVSSVLPTPIATHSSNNPMAGNVMRFKVKVKDKTLLIPVLQSNQDKTISWLAQEVSHRYYSLYGLRPLLTLATPEGAIFSPDDVISMVLVNNDEICANIDSWDLPPLHQRYKQSCKALSTVVYSNVSNILQSSETSGHLNLGHLALRPVMLQPIFRALQGQNNLTLLNLKGNRLGDNGVDNLSKTFEAMPNLTCLNLSCNGITSVGVKYFVDGLNNTLEPNSKHLQLLSCLKLSENMLGDGCIVSLSRLISSLSSLTSLHLSVCHLTAQCFQQHRIQLATSLTGSGIKELDISCNKFGTLGLELFIKSLNSQKITYLNMADTQSNNNISHLSLHLQQYVTQHGCSLKELNISGCNLSTDDIHTITRLPSSCPTLHKLWISKNTRITNHSLQQLLQQIVETERSQLDELIAEGCGIKSPLDTGFLDSLSDVLCRESPLRYFCFTCEGLDKVDTDCIQQIWGEKWKGLSQMVTIGNRIQLSAVEKTT